LRADIQNNKYSHVYHYDNTLLVSGPKPHKQSEVSAIVIDLLLCRVCNSEWNISEAVTQIIIKISLEAVPMFTRADKVKVNEDYGKEVVHVMSGAHMSSILQALDPFIVIIKQTPTPTCFLESHIDNPIKCPQMCKVGSSLEIL
jgi:hypothetical protein